MSTRSRETVRRSSSAAESRRLAPFLLAADESALAELEAMIATLPLCASGRVFVEVDSADDIGLIEVPTRMTVTWLPRSTRSGAPGTGRTCGRGEALARAVTAWADEMLCSDDDETRIDLLGGFLGTADIADHLTERRGVDPARIHAPVRFGLFAR